MRRRVLDGLMGAAILAVLGALWYVWGLGAMVMRHDRDLGVVINALVQNGTLRTAQPQPPAQAAPTEETKP